MKKFLSVLCAMTISFGCMTSAVFADDSYDDVGISPYSLLTKTNDSYLNIVSNTAYCKSEVEAYSTDANIYITQTFQKKSGSTWTDVSKVSKMFYSYKAEYPKEYPLISSGTYRVKTEATVYSGTKSEKTTSYNK